MPAEELEVDRLGPPSRDATVVASAVTFIRGIASRCPTAARRLAPVGAAAVASALSFWPALRHPGWPANHESWVWAVRSGVLRDAWRRGDWFPLWWREGNLGMGSPMPALYHKLQNYLTTLFNVFTGDIKLAAIASLACFGTVGCLGLRALALKLGASPWAALAYGTILPFTGYAMSDWLVRGAFAEYAGFMLLPWLFLALVTLVQDGKLRIGLASGVMIALFYAHSLTALYSGGPIIIAALLALVLHRGQRWRLLARGAVACAVFGLAVAPMVWVMKIMTQPVNFAHAIRRYYDVTRHFTSLSNALFVGQGPAVLDFRIAPEPELWVALAAGALLLALRRTRATVMKWRDPALALLCLSFALMAFMQTAAAAPVYEHVPGLRYIQFPWRLLSFETIILLALSAWVGARSKPWPATSLSLALFVVIVARSRAFNHQDLPGGETLQTLEGALDPRTHVTWAEYLPAVPGPANGRQLRHWASSAGAIKGTCSVEVGGCARCFVADCTGPAILALPYAYSGLELVTDASGRSLPTHREPRDARVLVHLSEPHTELRYRAPSWNVVLRRLFSHYSP